MYDKDNESRRDRILKILRSLTGVSPEVVSDEDLLSRTANTHMRASIDLHIAMEDFSKAMNQNFKKTQDGFIKAFSRLRNKF